MKRSYIALQIILCLLMAGCSSKKEAGKEEETKQEEPVVKVQSVSATDVPQLFTYTAQTEADKVNNISSSMPLRIKQILVDEGQDVARGQRLVVLDDVNTTSYKLQLDNAVAQLQNIKADYDRAVRLLEIGGGTRQQVDQMHTQLIAAQNNVASARRALANASENAVLTSPVSGVVTARNYDPGDMTSTMPVLTVAQVQPMKILINVSETEYPLIHVGMAASVKPDTYPDEVFPGTISRVMPTVDPSTRTFGVEISVPNADRRLLPGMFARVELNLGEKRHVVVPDLAVVKQQGSGGRYVYIYHPDTKTVSYSKVELGQRVGAGFEILSGVEDGAQVVVSGMNALSNGAKVKLAGK